MVFLELKKNGLYDFSTKTSLRVKIDWINVCKILETFTEGNPKYSRKNVKMLPWKQLKFIKFISF